jgi:hypothetical protein
MTVSPDKYSMSHITHINNLPGIIRADCLMSDARRRRGEFECTNIGHMNIKDRRMVRAVPVGGVLGDYVPFNFCVRSVMLCAIYYKKVAGYEGNQHQVIHLCSTVGDAVRSGRRWTFTDRHAELCYAKFFDDLADLSRIDWKVMPLRSWGVKEIKETRQAEFLVHDSFPWPCVRWIGVHNSSVKELVTDALSGTSHQPTILIKPEWYYP